MNELHENMHVIGTTICHFIRSNFCPGKLLTITYNFKNITVLQEYIKSLIPQTH